MARSVTVILHEEAIAEVKKLLRRKTGDIADDILRDAKGHAPVDTGELRDSGYVDTDGGDKWEIGFTADHASEVEFGTRRMPPRPYLEPAALKRREV